MRASKILFAVTVILIFFGSCRDRVDVSLKWEYIPSLNQYNIDGRFNVDRNNNVWITSGSLPNRNTNGIYFYNQGDWNELESYSFNFPNTYATQVISKNDNIWFGITDTQSTSDKILRYDGISFTSITVPSDLQKVNGIVTVHYVDDSQNIWVSKGRKIGNYKNNNWSLYDLPNEVSETIWGILPNKDDDSFWVCCLDAIVLIRGKEIVSILKEIEFTNKKNEKQKVPVSGASQPVRDSKNNIWFPSAYGLLKLNGTEWVVINNTNSNVNTRGFSSVSIDSRDQIWASSGIGIHKLANDNWTYYKVPNKTYCSGCPPEVTPTADAVFCIRVDQLDRKWVYGYGQSILRLDNE